MRHDSKRVNFDFWTYKIRYLLSFTKTSTVFGEWKEYGLESENITCIYYDYAEDYFFAGTSQGLYVCSLGMFLSHLPTEDPKWVKTDIPEKLVTNICSSNLYWYEMVLVTTDNGDNSSTYSALDPKGIYTFIPVLQSETTIQNNYLKNDTLYFSNGYSAFGIAFLTFGLFTNTRLAGINSLYFRIVILLLQNCTYSSTHMN